MSLERDIAGMLPDECWSSELEVLASYGRDKWSASALPDLVVLPRSSEEVAIVLRYAHEHKVPVTARGGGVGYVGGCVPVCGGICLSLERMNRILEIAPGDGVAVVEAGVITADLQAAVREKGWFYPPDPASRKECTIGGNIATNAGGPRCLKYGVTKAYVLGLTVVLANGDIVTCGGRTHKNKTGFDLTGLFTGAEGMLGVVTQAILRIIPHPKAVGALSVSFDRFAHAAAAVQTILDNGHLPAALEITDRFTLQAAREYLGEGCPLPRQAEGHLIVETDGSRAAVNEELDELSRLLREQCHATDIVRADSEEEAEGIWGLRREFSYSLKATGMTKLNEDVVIPRSQLVVLVDFCERLARQVQLDIACFGHAGDGNIHTNIMVPDYQDPRQRQAADGAVDALFKKVLELGGAITGEHGVGLAKARWFGNAVGEANMQLHRRLKASLDPNHILNPGKMGL